MRRVRGGLAASTCVNHGPNPCLSCRTAHHIPPHPTSSHTLQHATLQPPPPLSLSLSPSLPPDTHTHISQLMMSYNSVEVAVPMSCFARLFPPKSAKEPGTLRATVQPAPRYSPRPSLAKSCQSDRPLLTPLIDAGLARSERATAVARPKSETKTRVSPKSAEVSTRV